jgi:polygalacturonase
MKSGMALLLLIATLGELTAGALAYSGTGGGVFDVLTHGAKGDGVADDSAAIHEAYSACRAAGGGTVLFRSGHTFASGPIEIACNDSVTMVQAGATIRARNTTVGWPFGLDSPEPSQGMTPRQMAPMLQISYGRNIAVEGGGVIDANGEMWWDGACGNWWCKPGHSKHSPGGPTAFRPFLFRLEHAVNVRIQNVSLENSGFWTLVPVHSSQLTIIDINVSAAYSQRPQHWPADRHDLLDTPNTDGIEPMWSHDVFISGARIINGDDCITVKSGSSDILVENLYCEHGDGLTIGSIWYDDVSNITYRNVIMNRTHNGPMIKGRSQGNATIRDILFEVRNKIMNAPFDFEPFLH